MNNIDLVEVAYNFVLDYFKNKNIASDSISFSDICDGVMKVLNISKKDFEKNIGSFYVDLMQDKRLIYLGNDKWNLKDRITLETYKKSLNSLYDYDSTVSTDESFIDNIENDIDNADSFDIVDDYESATSDDLDDIDFDDNKDKDIENDVDDDEL